MDPIEFFHDPTHRAVLCTALLLIAALCLSSSNDGWPHALAFCCLIAAVALWFILSPDCFGPDPLPRR